MFFLFTMHTYFNILTQAYSALGVITSLQPNVYQFVGILEFIALSCTLLFIFFFFFCCIAYYVPQTNLHLQGYACDMYFYSKRSLVQDFLCSSLPAVVIFLLIFPTLAALYFTFPLDAFVWLDHAQVDITAYQWNWFPFHKEAFGNRRHPVFFFFEYDATLLTAAIVERLFLTTNSISIVQPALVCITVTGADVVHSFEIRPLFIKLDAVPGYVQHYVCPVVQPISVSGHCTELCGFGHSFMPTQLSIVERTYIQVQHGTVWLRWFDALLELGRIVRIVRYIVLLIIAIHLIITDRYYYHPMTANYKQAVRPQEKPTISTSISSTDSSQNVGTWVDVITSVLTSRLYIAFVVVVLLVFILKFFFKRR